MRGQGYCLPSLIKKNESNWHCAPVFDNSSLLCGPRPFGMSKTPDEWLNIRNWGTEWKGKSLFVTPIIAEGEVIGFICYKNDKESAHDMIRLSAQFLAQFAEN